MESPFAEELANEWILADDEKLEAAGWATWASIVSVKKDEELDMKRLQELMQHVEKEIHRSKNRVRYTMNNFIICVGSYVNELSADARALAQRIGTVKVNVGKTACHVPEAPSYIEKAIARGSLLKKKKTVKC